MSVFRIKTDFILFNPFLPYDMNLSDTKRGTGFLVRLSGKLYIMTAHHVIDNAVSVFATSPRLLDGEAIKLDVVGQNPYLDVALLHHPSLQTMQEVTPFDIAPSSSLRSTDVVHVIGFAHGTLRTHTTTGTISGRHEFPHNRVQMDAPVNPGNSGGPVVNKERKVVGVCTSGMDDMQSTNFFAPMDEVLTACQYMLRHGIDLGRHLNAVVHPVDSGACGGAKGGALVALAPPDSPLRVGDVILQVQGKTRMLTLNSFMRVYDDGVWKDDSMDFRAMLDVCTTTHWKMKVRRRDSDQESDVDVPIGANRMKSRRLFPDCEPVKYATFGGIVVQTKSLSHTGEDTASFRTPEDFMVSKPIITYVSAGSPYAVHGVTTLVGAVVKGVAFQKDNWDLVHSIENFDQLLAKGKAPVAVQLESGERVGASAQALADYHRAESNPALTVGTHHVKHGMLHTRK